MAQPIPTEAYQLAEIYHLGTPTAVYKVQSARSDILVFVGIIFYLLIMFGFIITFTTLIITSPPHKTLLFPWFLIILIVGGLGNIISISLKRRKKQPIVTLPMRNLRVYVCTNGLIYLRHHKPDIIRWDQIKRVWYSPPNNKYQSPDPSILPSITVYRNDGKMFRFSNIFPDIEELCTTIQSEFANHRYQQTLK